MRNIKNQDGFTLIEMMIVLLIISVLILIAIPNVTKHSATIDQKGCLAFVRMVQGQVEAYRIELKSVPTIANLIEQDYLNADEISCPDGRPIVITDGVVSAGNVVQ